MAAFDLWEQAQMSTPRKKQVKPAVKPKGKPPKPGKSEKPYKGGKKIGYGKGS